MSDRPPTRDLAERYEMHRESDSGSTTPDIGFDTDASDPSRQDAALITPALTRALLAVMSADEARLQGIGQAVDHGAYHLDPFFDPHCAMSRRDVVLGIDLAPRVRVADLTSREPGRTAVRTLRLDARHLRRHTTHDAPERRAAIVLLRRREALMGLTEDMVRLLRLPRPQGGGILRWRPPGHITGSRPMPPRWGAIRHEMLEYNGFPWIDRWVANTGFIRPELYVIEAFYLSDLSIGIIRIMLRNLALMFDRETPISDDCSRDMYFCRNGCRICLGRQWDLSDDLFERAMSH